MSTQSSRVFQSDSKRSSSVPKCPPHRLKQSTVVASATGIAPSPLSRTSSDCFDILGLPVHADSKAIKTAYRQLARQYHPDVNRSDTAAVSFIEVRSAYEVRTLVTLGWIVCLFVK